MTLTTKRHHKNVAQINTKFQVPDNSVQQNDYIVYIQIVYQMQK